MRRLVRLLTGATLLLVFHVPRAVAEEAGVIEDIRIRGNHRTSSGFILQELRVRRGDTTDGDTGALRQRLLNTRVFRDVLVRWERLPGNGLVLDVYVVERWTLLPIPVLSSSGSSTSVGLLLYESNLAGWGKVLAIGGQVGGRKRMAVLAYRDPAVAGSRWVAGGTVDWHDERLERYSGSSLAYAFRDRWSGLSFDVGRRLTDRLSVGLGWFDTWARTGPEPGFAPPPRATEWHGPYATVTYRGEDYHFFYTEGVWARAELRQALAALSHHRSPRSGQLRVRRSGGNRLGHAWAIAVRGDWVEGDPYLDAVRLGGKEGTRGFEKDGLWAERAASGSLDYQIPVWKPSWGVVTAGALVDAGAVRWRGEDTRYVSAGVATRLFVAGVAIPAVAFELAESSAVRKLAFGVAVGFQFQ